MRFTTQDGDDFLRTAAEHGFPLREIAEAMNVDPNDLFLMRYGADLDPRAGDNPFQDLDDEKTRHIFTLHARNARGGFVPLLGAGTWIKGYELIRAEYNSEYTPNGDSVTADVIWRSAWMSRSGGIFAVQED